MAYDKENDFYKCRNGKQLKPERTKIKKSKTGYESEKTIYVCEDCSNCTYKSKCIKGNNCKTPSGERTKKFSRQRKEDFERITTDEGCKLRMNKNIQIKHDMDFRRLMCRGKNNVLAESILLALANNINKLHNKIQANRTGKHLFELKQTT